MKAQSKSISKKPTEQVAAAKTEPQNSKPKAVGPSTKPKPLSTVKIMDKIFGVPESSKPGTNPVSQRKIKNFDKKMEALAKATGGTWKKPEVSKESVPTAIGKSLEAKAALPSKSGDQKKFVIPLKKEANPELGFKIVIPTDILTKYPAGMKSQAAKQHNKTVAKKTKSFEEEKQMVDGTHKKPPVVSKPRGNKTALDAPVKSNVEAEQPRLGKRQPRSNNTILAEVVTNNSSSVQLSAIVPSTVPISPVISHLLEDIATFRLQIPPPVLAQETAPLSDALQKNQHNLVSTKKSEPAVPLTIPTAAAIVDISLDELILVEVRSPQTPKSAKKVFEAGVPLPPDLKARLLSPNKQLSEHITAASTAKASVADIKHKTLSTELQMNLSLPTKIVKEEERPDVRGDSPVQPRKELPARVKAISKPRRPQNSKVVAKPVSSNHPTKHADRFRGLLESVRPPLLDEVDLTEVTSVPVPNPETENSATRTLVPVAPPISKPWSWLSNFTLTPEDIAPLPQTTEQASWSWRPKGISRMIEEEDRTKFDLRSTRSGEKHRDWVEFASEYTDQELAHRSLLLHTVLTLDSTKQQSDLNSTITQELSAILVLTKVYNMTPRWSSPGLRRYAIAENRVWRQCRLFAFVKPHPVERSAYSGDAIHDRPTKIAFDIWDREDKSLQNTWIASISTIIPSTRLNPRRFNSLNAEFGCPGTNHQISEHCNKEARLEEKSALIQVFSYKDAQHSLLKMTYDSSVFSGCRWQVALRTDSRSEVAHFDGHLLLEEAQVQCFKLGSHWSLGQTDEANYSSQVQMNWLIMIKKKGKEGCYHLKQLATPSTTQAPTHGSLRERLSQSYSM